jgi:hypothetical protein
MRSRSDQFRAQAAECHKLASRCRDLTKTRYEELAQQWLELAERAERQDSAAHEPDGSRFAPANPRS